MARVGFKFVGVPSSTVVKNFLGSLGRRPVEIANSLKAMGVKGTRGNAQTCALAEAMREAFPDAAKSGVYVKPSSITVGPVYVYTEGAQREFINQFDESAYPELVR